MRHSRRCAWVNRDSRQMCEVTCVQAPEWLVPWEGSSWSFIRTGHVSALRVSLSSVSTGLSVSTAFSASTPFFSGYSSSYLLFYPQSSSTFNAVSDTSQSRCRVVIYFLVHFHSLLVCFVGPVWGSWLSFATVDIGHFFGLQVGFEPVICCNLDLWCFTLVPFDLCSSCLRILDSDFGNYAACWHLVNYVYDNFMYLNHIDSVSDSILTSQLSQLDLLELFFLIAGFVNFFDKGSN